MQQAAPSKFGIIAVISTVIILILVLVLALASFFVRPESQAAVELFEAPLVSAAKAQVDPALSIALLAGVAEEDVIEQAITKARPGTALATLIASPNLDTKDMAGTLLLLGEKFAQQDDEALSRLSFQLAGVLATLSPDMADTLRSDIFLQTGLGLIDRQEPVLAKVYLDQAALVGKESPFLQAAYRQNFFTALHKAYLALGLKDEARRFLDLSLSPPDLTSVPQRPLVLPQTKQIALPIQVQEAEGNRWQAAQFVVKDLVELGGIVRPEILEALRVTLLQEDEAKTRYFEEAVQTETQFSAKANVIQAKIEWQSIKYRIARKGFGMSLVPEWEAAIVDIERDLAASYGDLYRFYNDIIVAIPNASDIDRATEELLRRQVLAGQLGFYPNYPAEETKQQLLRASATLIETQPGTELRVSVLAVGDIDYYTLISDQDVLNPAN